MDWDRIRRISGRGNGNEDPPTCRIPAQPAILNSRVSKVLIPSLQEPADTASPSLSSLGPDVLSIIMDSIHHESPASLSCVALVNSTYYRLARYSQFRDIVLDLATRHNDPDRTGHLHALSAYLENAGLLPAVRELRVSCRSTNASNGELSQVTTLIPKLTGLTDLVWHVPQPIPDAVLNHLQDRPSLRLHTRALNLASRTTRKPRDGMDVSLLSKLQHSINLHSLEVVQTFVRPAESLAVTKPLRQILLSCPNLRRLKLDIGMPTGGCVIMSPPREYCGLGFQDGERPLAALEELDLIRYPFGVPRPVGDPDIEKPIILGWPSYCDAYPLPVCEEAYWAENFDWSRIKRLVAPSILGMRLIPYLTSVREMNMTQGRPGQLQKLYEQVPAALQAITVNKIGDVGLGPILRHGPALRKLQIHQTESAKSASQAVSLDDLAAIRNNCPFIDELGIDLARDGRWPYEAFDILASFPNLRRLQLWFALGVADKETPIRPYTTFHASQEIGRYFLAKSARSPPCLRTIQINSGSPAPLGFGYPAPTAFWPSSNSTSFLCQLSDRDDEATGGVFTTTCTKVKRPGNDFLNSIQAGLSDEEFKQRLGAFSKSSGAQSEITNSRNAAFATNKNCQSICLAYYGPTPLSRWKRH